MNFNSCPKRNTYLHLPKTQSVSSASSLPNYGHPHGLPIALPPGWKREECIRQNGLYTGKTDVYYISPDGDKIRTKHEMKAILGDGYDLSFFDWRSGKFVSPSAKVRRSEDCTEPSAPKIPRADSPVLPFVRRTSPPNNLAPFVIRSHPDCKRSDAKNIQQEPPHQLFWEKRFTDVCAVDPDTGEAFKPLPLPRGIQTAGVPGYKPAQLVQSIIHALNTREIPIIGQEQPPSAVEKNPCIAVNPVQPMIKTCIVSDDDIRRQEARVKELRRKLELARKKLNPRYSTERHG